MTEGAENGFVETSAKRIGAKEFDREIWRPDERPEDPRELAAEQEISCQPGEENLSSGAGTSAQFPKQLNQPKVCGDAGKGNHRGLREQHDAVR